MAVPGSYIEFAIDSLSFLLSLSAFKSIAESIFITKTSTLWHMLYMATFKPLQKALRLSWAAYENFIQNGILAYNMTRFVVTVNPFENLHDPRNPLIGLTYGYRNFRWPNGQPICEDFRNWNLREPNNYAGTVSNGEDYAQKLIMNQY